MAELSTGTGEQKRKRIITLVLLAVLLMSASLFLSERRESSLIIVTFPSGTQLEAEVADTPEKLLFGLAFREALPPGTGMLYIYESTGLHRVRTQQYRFPVDILWIDESHQIVAVFENAAPCGQDPCPLYGPPPEPARYVIQAEAGFIRKEGLTPGDELKYSLRM